MSIRFNSSLVLPTWSRRYCAVSANAELRVTAGAVPHADLPRRQAGSLQHLTRATGEPQAGAGTCIWPWLKRCQAVFKEGARNKPLSPVAAAKLVFSSQRGAL